MFATGIRPLGPTVVMALVAALWLRPARRKDLKRNVRHTLFVLLLGALPILAWVVHDVRAAAAGRETYIDAVLAMYDGHLLKGVWRMVAQVPSTVDSIGEAVTGVGLGVWGGLPVAAIVAVGLVRMARSGEWLLPAYVVAGVLGVWFGGSMGRRYLVPVLPFLFYGFVLGLQPVLARLPRREWLTRSRLRWLMALCLAAVLVMNVVRVGKVVFENRMSDFFRRFDKGRWERYIEASGWLRQNAEAADVIAGYEVRIIHLWTRHRVVQLPRDWAGIRGEDKEEKLAQYCKGLLVNGRVRYLLLDSRKATISAAANDLLAEWSPDAFAQVFERDGLRLLRVEIEKLKDGPSPPRE